MGYPGSGQLPGEEPVPDPTTRAAAGFGGGAVLARRALTVALTAWGLYLLAHPGAFTLLDSVDLAIHESGHVVFGPFGEFIGFAGGTIMQLLMPAAFVVYFRRRGEAHSSSVALWWVAQNLGNVATYVADARAQELPLVGGGEHDWNYLLGRLHLLPHDVGIARGIRVVALLLMASAAVWGLSTAPRRDDAA